RRAGSAPAPGLGGGFGGKHAVAVCPFGNGEEGFRGKPAAPLLLDPVRALVKLNRAPPGIRRVRQDAA
ncbi:MAG: hypothetical protein ACK5QX_07925, partial [bacterium]